MSFWIKFFKEAGIPAGDAANYAVTFTDNRIVRAMLMDLTKEYLNDMGISILGDVIAILKHAKSVHSQDVRDRVLKDNAVVEQTLPLKRSTPASRTIGHYIGTPERSASPLLNAASPKISRELSARLGAQGTTTSNQVKQQPSGLLKITTQNVQKEVVPVPPKNRKVFPEDEGHYTINLPQGSTAKTKKILARQRQQAELQRIRAEEDKKRVNQKTTVFSRLGKEKTQKASESSSSSEPTVTITGLGNINMPTSTTSNSIFARLGGKSTVKRPATSTVDFDDDDDNDDDGDLSDGDPLEYAGVLKASPTKKAKLDAANKIKKTAKKTLVKAKVTERPQTAGVLAGSSISSDIKSRLGLKTGEVSSTTQVKASTAVKSSKQGAVSRLNTKSLDNITVTVGTTSKTKTSVTSPGSSASGVFSRLGKPKS
ncbi:hypothetical protein ACF0H5_003613 [Mactra antiquata]